MLYRCSLNQPATMSMEDRCQQFHQDAQRPRDENKTPKEIKRLRQFLHKNQEHRFTDKEQTYLFQAIGSHVTIWSGGQQTSASQDDDEDNPALALVEDALKMPFTVFTTSQKKTMLKWLDKLRGLQDKGQGEAQTASIRQRWTVIDLTNSSAMLMNDDGEEHEVALSNCSNELVEKLQKLFTDQDAVAAFTGADCTTILDVA